jgi:hypothetical protein
VSKVIKDLKVIRVAWEFRDPKESQDLKDPRDPQDLRV